MSCKCYLIINDLEARIKEFIKEPPMPEQGQGWGHAGPCQKDCTCATALYLKKIFPKEG